MKPSAFIRHVPRSGEEAVAMLAEFSEEDGRVLAGGQSLVPMMAFRLARPAHLIDINQVPEFKLLSAGNGELSVGATVRHAAFHRPVEDGPTGRLLSTVVRHIAHYPIRTRGTMCGSLAHSDPASEWCLVAATLGATMIARSVDGRRNIPAEDYFLSMMQTALTEKEMLEGVRLPLLLPDTKFGFSEFNRRAGDFAIAATLATFRVVDGVMCDARLGVGGAEEFPRRIAAAEAAMNGKPPTDEAFRAVAEAAAEAVDPMEDRQADAEFRRDLVRVMTRRALEQAVAE
jgi:carbon-monoxide dehydrogenase medium subunit